MCLLAALCCAAQCCAATPGCAVDVWIDVDTAIGRPAKDVDDGLALVLALRSPELSIRGISATYGNASLETAIGTTREVLDRFGGAQLPVHAGARSAGDRGVETDATRALAAELARRPLTILALGPLTTVATVLALHPELSTHVQRLVMVAGRRPGQRFAIEPAHWHTFPDLNFELDPAAAASVLAAPVPLALAGWEVASKLWVSPADLERVGRSGSGGVWIQERANTWASLWRWVLQAPGFNPFDTLAVGYVAHPELFTTEPVELSLQRGPDRLIAHPAAGETRAVYCAKASPRFHELLLRALEGPDEAQTADAFQRAAAPSP
jgi:inosine-uridine nucleoside N-ribohydrolase